MKDKIKVIAFDADDTLWESENHIQLFENRFCMLMSDYASKEEISKKLFDSEMKNLHLYGYGIKGMMLCMIEVANETAKGKEVQPCINEIIRLGQELLKKPVTLLKGVEEVVRQLGARYSLILVTKGDLLDQERKITGSGLQSYFSRIEIMSDKKVGDYRKILDVSGFSSDQFLMVGNSVKSDIEPVLELGGHAVHIPFHVTWKHEQHHTDIVHGNFLQLDNIKELINYL